MLERFKINTKNDDTEKIEQEMFDHFLNSPLAKEYCRKNGLDDETVRKNITKLYDFFLDIETCANCKGMKNCPKEVKYLCTKIENENDMIVRHIVPCKYYIKYQAFIKSFVVHDFDDSFFDADIKTIDKTKERLDAIKKFMDFVKGKSSESIYLIGGPRTGRSYIAAAMCTHAINNNIGPVAFINCAKRFKELNDLNYHDKDQFDDKLNLYCTVPILVLDDFGNELKNDFVRDAILFQIINERANNKLYTIFTSDFNINEIIDSYSISKASTVRAKQIGRIVSSMVGTEIDLKSIALH